MEDKIKISELINVEGIGQKTLNNVYQHKYKDIKKSKEEVDFPNDKFHIIYADPPWKYNDRNSSSDDKKFGSGAENHYECMELEDIKALPVEKIAENNAVLFMWVTFPFLKEGLEVIKAWGFEYKTLGFDWTKRNQDGSVWFGIGSYTKSNNEVCLLATRGNVGRIVKDKQGNIKEFNPKEKLQVQSNKVSCNIQAKRRKHSQKPKVSRKRIEKLFGDVSRIELFARNSAKGWTSWGNEVDKYAN